jgi:hypothetical protein
MSNPEAVAMKVKPGERLHPTDPPILLAGLIAARQSGDRLLAKVMTRELAQRGITVRFLTGNEQKAAANAG